MSTAFTRARRVAAVVVFAASAALPAVALARDGATDAVVEVAAGPSFTRNNELTAVASVSWLPHWRDTAHGALRFDLGAVYVHGRGQVPGFDLDGNVLVGYAGTRYERDNGFVFGTGIGLQAGRTDALSGNPQFVSSIGWRWSRTTLLLRHISNASIRQPNDGETMLVLGWRF